MTTQDLRYAYCIPANAFVHIPDNWKAAGTVRVSQFEFAPTYTDGERTMSEPALLKAGIASFRVQVDRFTVRDFVLPLNS
jgi:hypothetical protein